MLKIVLASAAVATITCICFAPDAAADGVGVRHKRVRHSASQCWNGPCVPVGCPDKYSCWSLYGAYGPYSGAAYLTRYTYFGWGYR